MTTAILLLGSNLGNRLLNLGEALEGLVAQGVSLVEITHVYESDPWGFDASNRFLNLAASVEFGASPSGLLSVCLTVETMLGRVREGVGYHSRIIDIDILLCGNQIIRLPELTVPHPRLPLRRFALVPLVQLIPDEIHPELNLTFRQLLDRCPDQGDVILYCQNHQVWIHVNRYR